MHSPQAIWHVLQADLIWLAKFSAFAGAIMLVPALATGFAAATKIHRTRWIDLPMGTFWSWLAGTLMAILFAPIFWGMLQVVQQVTRTQHSSVVDLAGVAFMGIAFLLSVAAQYQAAARYFEWMYKERFGWKIDDEPPKPANHRYSFSLKQLLLIQIVAVMVFGSWIGLRRQAIEAQNRWQQHLIWEADARSRLDGYGWEVKTIIRPLHLFGGGGSRLPITDAVFDKIHVSDKLESIVLLSDHITDAGLAKLSPHKGLYRIEIQSNQVTDAGIAHITQLPALESVSVRCEKITDQSLMALRQMRSLQTVYIEPRVFSQQAIDVFRAARPDVSLHTRSAPAK
jgi:hypothetical protein